ncbi:type VI secretion system Vgr family protein [Acidovorax sp. Leaf78]|uniref:type VI secretion system Vgr family protein n=1 Tax=Acidovorax sp. Leaf78 TaxID=1736237 RepID=UPI0006F2F9EE|nr:type VI secretion system tip protein VgrG [Acidovorax sp. Leaf78]KQO27208.1 ImpA family type VI secretion-associated protein [Acidovorax sp. Leaf78]
MSQRRTKINTPLGDTLQLRQLHGTEELSRLFTFNVQVISESKTVDPKALLGKSATVEVETDGGGKRYLNGVISRFGMRGQDASKYSYFLEMRPWLWLATRKTDFKIFQNMTVPDIIRDVLGKYGEPMEFRLTKAYPSVEYLVQYSESDCNLVCRLAEDLGIYFHFKHSSGSHTLVFCDDTISSHEPMAGGGLPFYPPEKAAVAREENLDDWDFTQGLRSGKVATDDFDFKKPRADLTNTRKMPPGHANDGFETYEFPGQFTEYDQGEHYAKVRVEEHIAAHERVAGQGNARNLVGATGCFMTLRNYPREDQNVQHLLISVTYHFTENVQVSDASVGSTQRFALEALPTTRAFRPARITPKPRTQGLQTAWVVGPPGEEIYCDKYGRVKVQFHWDRIGAMDENSSCWMRFSSSWAGSNFGAIAIPRIRMEVLVDHIDANPDRPIIVGVVYNADNMPPWSLPANQTQSGIKTRSSKGGAAGAGMKNGPGDANALRFEDKAGQEQLWLHAQKDQLTEVENDEEKWVGRDREKTIDRDETNTIHRDRTETVDRNEKITVHGWRTEEVDGDETITIHSNRKERVDHNETVDIGDNQTFKIGINRTKTVGKNEKDKIGSNWSIKVGKFKTETVGIAYMQNVGVGRMENVGVVYNLNVGAVMATLVGKDQSTKVGSDKTTTVGTKYALTVGGGGGGSGGTAAGGAAGAGGPKNIVAPSGGAAGSGEGGGGGGSNIFMDADSITLSVGASTFVMKKDGTVTLNGHDLTVTMTGEQVITADGNITMKGAKILEN